MPNMIYSLPGNHRNNGEKLSSSTMEVKRQFATNKIGVPMSHTHPYTLPSTKADRVAIKKQARTHLLKEVERNKLSSIIFIFFDGNNW